MKELLEYLIKNWYFYRLLGMARKRWGNIELTPCGSKTNFFDCTTVQRRAGKVSIWYNTPDHSTRVETIRYKKVRKS